MTIGSCVICSYTKCIGKVKALHGVCGSCTIARGETNRAVRAHRITGRVGCNLHV